MEKVTAFFTFFRAETDTDKMKIPISFTQRMRKPFPKKVFLRDRHNQLWTVKMVKVGDYWYFINGWNAFVKKNSLTSMDLLVFSYFCENLFNVKMYGLSATEKNIRSCVQISESKVDDDDDSDDDDYEDEYEDYDDEYDFDEITESENGVHLSENGEYEDEEGVQVSLENVNNDGVVGIHKQEMLPLYLYPKCYGMEIFEAGLAEKPINPFFVAKFMPKRNSSLFIPRDVIYDYDLTIGNEIILVDPRGRKFLSECRRWSDGRIWVTKGWARLCRVNSVKENDKCICEFVENEGDERQYLHISIVRSNI